MPTATDGVVPSKGGGVKGIETWGWESSATWSFMIRAIEVHRTGIIGAKWPAPTLPRSIQPELAGFRCPQTRTAGARLRSCGVPYFDPIAPHKPTPVELFLTGQSGPDVQPMRLLQNLLLPVLVLALCGRSAADGLPDTVSRIKSSIVAVGTHVSLRGSSQSIRRTGFVVAGHYAVTSAHAVPSRCVTFGPCWSGLE